MMFKNWLCLMWVLFNSTVMAQGLGVLKPDIRVQQHQSTVDLRGLLNQQRTLLLFIDTHDEASKEVLKWVQSAEGAGAQDKVLVVVPFWTKTESALEAELAQVLRTRFVMDLNAQASKNLGVRAFPALLDVSSQGEILWRSIDGNSRSSQSVIIKEITRRTRRPTDTAPLP